MLAPDGKMRSKDVADMEQMFRLIQSIPSKKAEPVKEWMTLEGMGLLAFFVCINNKQKT